jgi:hypothetical protein
MARPRKYPIEQPDNVVNHVDNVVNYGTDAGIEVSLFLPGKEKHEFVIRIRSIAGELMGSQKNPEVFEMIIRDIVRARFGSKVQ